jgi:hypothetical protein
MLQVAFGGYYLITGGENFFYDDPVYYEPGFNWMNPVEIESPAADQLYILVRKRAGSTGTAFVNVSSTDFEISVTDATTGESIFSSIYDNSLHTDWNTDPSSYTPLVAYIRNAVDFTEANMRVRVLDCYIKDTTDDSFVRFRVLVSDANRYFHYLPFVTNDLSYRYKASALGRQAYITVSGLSDSYLLVSPYAYLQEVEKTAIYDFSYPLDSIYYQRQHTYNDEDFDFSLASPSDDFVNTTVSLIPVPKFHKVAVIHIDRFMYKKLQEKEDVASINLNIVGRLSGHTDQFVIYFRR